MYLVPLAILQPDLTFIPGDFGDARFNNYILEHGYLWISGVNESFWDAPFMYPFKNVIAFSDNLLGTMPFYAFFRFLGSDRETAFQLWILLLFALNFFCCYWALNKWAQNRILAAVGAYVFTFSIYILGQLNHIQLTPRFMVPLVLYWTWVYFKEGSSRHFAYALFGLVYQFYCGVYLGFFLILAQFFMLVSVFVVERDWKFFKRFVNLNWCVKHVGIIVGTVLLMLPLMLPYVEIRSTTPERIYEELANSMPRIQSYFFAHPGAKMWGILTEHGKTICEPWWFHWLFVGALPWLTLLLLPFAVYRSKGKTESRRLILVVALALVLTILFTVRIGGVSLYIVIFNLPGFNSIRSLNRIINVEVVFLILLMVIVYKALLDNSKLRSLIWVLPIIVIVDNLIIPENVIRFEKAVAQVNVSVIKNSISRNFKPGYKAIAYMPYFKGEQLFKTHLEVMLAAQELHIPCVNGYSGYHPMTFSHFFEQINKSGLKEWCNSNQISTSSILQVSENEVLNDTMRIQLKAVNGKFFCADPNSNFCLIANRNNGLAWETFDLIPVGKEWYVFRAHTGKYLSVTAGLPVSAIENQQDKSTQFKIVKLQGNRIRLVTKDLTQLSFSQNDELLYQIPETQSESGDFKLIIVNP